MKTPIVQYATISMTIIGLYFIMLGLWTIDIGVSGMINNSPVTNGWDWGTRSAVQQYHIGLWLVGIGALISVISSIFGIIDWRRTT